jgi:hypothetical protein
MEKQEECAVTNRAAQQKERQFHGEYLQGRRPEQYESAAIIMGYTLGIILGSAIILGLFFAGRWFFGFIQAI